jgi:hypothetical protein
MAAPLTPDQWLRILRAEGVRVEEYPGWRTRERDDETGLPFGPVRLILNHHTAGRDSRALVAERGVPGLPAPLAHIHLAKSGVATMCSAGRANHAGPMAVNAYQSFRDEHATHPAPNRATGTIDGNDVAYGVETENLGNGTDVYPRAQYDAWVRIVTAVCRHHGWSAESVACHKETSVEGKIDPRGPVEGYGSRGRFEFTPERFRADVAERLEHGPDWSPGSTTGSEDGMPEYVNLGVTEDYTLRPGTWDSVEFTREWTDEPGQHATGGTVWARGPARFTGTVSVALSGLPAGEVVQVRMSEYDGDTFAQDHPVHEIHGTEGGTFAVIPLTKRIGPGRHMRIRLLNTAAQPVTVTSVVLTVLVWKES